MTPEERERRIEAAARAFYEPAQPQAWVVPPVLLRNMTRAFAAAEEAVPTVSETVVNELVWLRREEQREALKQRAERAESALRPEEEVRTKFEQLADQWESETLLVASPTEAAVHYAYQRIVGLGLQAVPLLLERLARTHRAWFWALSAITHENPAAGLQQVDDAVSAWLEWGRLNGYYDG